MGSILCKFFFLILSYFVLFCELGLSIASSSSLYCKPSWPSTDGLWDDGRTDEGQLGLHYHELEEAMDNPNSQNRVKYESIRKQNLHKMEPIPVCKIPN